MIILLFLSSEAYQTEINFYRLFLMQVELLNYSQ